jgi:magnesium transporter
MLGTCLRPEIEELIKARNFSDLREALLELRPADIAEILADVPPQDEAVIFRLLPKALATDVFERMTSTAQRRLIRSLGQKEVAEILNGMTPDDRTALLEDLPESMAQRLLGVLSPEEYRVAAQLLAYPPESVGRRMTPEFVSIRSDWSVGQVLRHLRHVGKSRKVLDVLYVTDAEGHLVDEVHLREIALADPHTPVSQLLDHQVDAVTATDDQETAVRMFQRSGRTRQRAQNRAAPSARLP